MLTTSEAAKVPLVGLLPARVGAVQQTLHRKVSCKGFLLLHDQQGSAQREALMHCCATCCCAGCRATATLAELACLMQQAAAEALLSVSVAGRVPSLVQCYPAADPDAMPVGHALQAAALPSGQLRGGGKEGRRRCLPRETASDHSS